MENLNNFTDALRNANFSTEELDSIVDLITRLRKKNLAASLLEFAKGEPVRCSISGDEVEGTVARVNATSLTVLVDGESLLVKPDKVTKIND